MKEEETGAPCAEDGDPLVRAVERLGDGWAHLRKPGFLQFGFACASLSLRVTRSRFAGDYGSICRMQRILSDGVQDMTFAPTASVFDAVTSSGPEKALEDLFNEWKAKG